MNLSVEPGQAHDSARNGAFDILLVGYVSRWQRNLRRTLELLEDRLHPGGVAVWFADEEILSSCDRHWDQLVDEAKDAERYSRRLARRIREGYASKRAKQRDPGGHPPFGFRRNEAKLLEPDPDKLDLVRSAFERSAAGALDQDIAESLGLPIDTIRGMLRSPLYISRLRDGSEAHWPALVPLELADKVAAVRATRATSTGRKASPSRPYALAMLHCAHCAKRISGDSGFYRHDKACPEYRAAQPDLPASRRGRRDGKGYRRELIEDAVGVLLDRVSLNAYLVSEVVGRVVPARCGPDETVLRRIERERADAAALVVRDRDYEALRATMERLDREEASARAIRQTEGIPADRAVRYPAKPGRSLASRRRWAWPSRACALAILANRRLGLSGDAVPSDRSSHRPWLRLRRPGHFHGNCWIWSGREEWRPRFPTGRLDRRRSRRAALAGAIGMTTGARSCALTP